MEGKPVLSGPWFEGFIPSFGPGEFVSESGHGSWILSTEALTKLNFPNNIMPLEGIIKLKIVANYDDMGFDRRKKICVPFQSFLLGSEMKIFSPINDHLKAEKNGRHAKNKDSDSDKDDHDKGRGEDEGKGKGKK